jgi:hypothetical protein
MAVHMVVPGRLAASHDGQKRVLFARKAVNLLSNEVVGLVFRVVDAEELPVVFPYMVRMMGFLSITSGVLFHHGGPCKLCGTS